MLLWFENRLFWHQYENDYEHDLIYPWLIHNELDFIKHVFLSPKVLFFLGLT